MKESSLWLYIDITDSKLCQQFYTRLVEQHDTDWTYIPSSKHIIKQADIMKKEHLSHGYVLLSIEKIKKIIIIYATR